MSKRFQLISGRTRQTRTEFFHHFWHAVLQLIYNSLNHVRRRRRHQWSHLINMFYYGLCGGIHIFHKRQNLLLHLTWKHFIEAIIQFYCKIGWEWLQCLWLLLVFLQDFSNGISYCCCFSRFIVVGELLIECINDRSHFVFYDFLHCTCYWFGQCLFIKVIQGSIIYIIQRVQFLCQNMEVLRESVSPVFVTKAINHGKKHTY